MDEQRHISVLREELVNMGIHFTKKNTVIDATLGLGWHAVYVLSKMNDSDIFVGVDADSRNLADAKKQISDFLEKEGKNIQCFFFHGNFSEIGDFLCSHNISSVSNIYYDLGVSSVHYDDGGRGFSFRFDEPLDMRFDTTTQVQTAADIVKKYSIHELTKIFREYGEDGRAYQIAHAIEKNRKQKDILSTGDLLEILKKVSHDPKAKVRIFQALRMEVNEELHVIRKSLESISKYIEIEWMISVITFHSVEDRLVKHVFRDLCEDTIDERTGMTLVPGSFKKVNKKPIIPTDEEIEKNPRSRSAKLRIIKKIYE